MNNDIVPSLLEEIQKQFDEEIKANEKIKSILIRQKQGAVDYTDSLSFAKELGVSLKKVISMRKCSLMEKCITTLLKDYLNQ